MYPGRRKIGRTPRHRVRRLLCALIGHMPHAERGRSVCCERCGLVDRVQTPVTAFDVIYYVNERNGEPRLVIDRSAIPQRTRMSRPVW